MFSSPQKSRFVFDALPTNRLRDKVCTKPSTPEREVSPQPSTSQREVPPRPSTSRYYATVGAVSLPMGTSVSTQTGLTLSSSSPRKQALQRQLRIERETS
ncbi:unnamed protein product, partial [Tenebrio molitor]